MFFGTFAEYEHHLKKLNKRSALEGERSTQTRNSFRQLGI
jgi:hypothetical protein